MYWLTKQRYFQALALIILLGTHSAEIINGQYNNPAELAPFVKQQEPYASTTMNVYQPLNMPPYTQSIQTNAMFMTPPPPQVYVSSLIPTTPFYTNEERPITTKVNIMDYAQQLDNPFNYYSMNRSYNPYLGPSNPANPTNPFNMLYGSSPFAVASGFGRPPTSGLGGAGQSAGQYVPNNFSMAAPQGGFMGGNQFGMGMNMGMGGMNVNMGMGMGGGPVGMPGMNMPGMGGGVPGMQNYNVFADSAGPFGHLSNYNVARKLKNKKTVPRKNEKSETQELISQEKQADFSEKENGGAAQAERKSLI